MTISPDVLSLMVTESLTSRLQSHLLCPGKAHPAGISVHGISAGNPSGSCCIECENHADGECISFWEEKEKQGKDDAKNQNRCGGNGNELLPGEKSVARYGNCRKYE